MKAPVKARIGRAPLLVAGIACLVGGVWGGLVRLPLNLPLPGGNANWLSLHGPLMVCGFLGTVIALERAVGLRSWWTYIAPALTACGAAMIVAGRMGTLPVNLILAGSAAFWLVTLRVVRLQPVPFTILMSAGALAWAVGNAGWRAGWPFNRVVPWWILFLALTILGERLDLSRFQKPSRWSAPLLYASLVLLAGGVTLAAFRQVTGERIAGLGLVAVAAWLGRFDLARKTIRQPGLSRFMAACLLTGYVWLAVTGALLFRFAPLESGFRYDAVLHAFFLGFVFLMIFAHAPVIFPAVLMLQPAFRKWSWSHAILLQLALMLRVGSDLASWAPGRQWGSVAAAAALALFLVNTIGGFLVPAPVAGTSRRSPSA